MGLQVAEKYFADNRIVLCCYSIASAFTIRFFATLADGLPGKPKSMVDGDLMEYLSDRGRVIESQREIPVGSRFPRPTLSRGLLFDATTPVAAGEYTGG